MTALLLLAVCLARAPEGAPLHPPKVAPVLQLTMADARPFDADGDRLDDNLRAALRRLGPKDRLRTEWLFSRPVTQAQLDAFVAAGGTLEWVFQAASYGFIAEVGRDQVPALLRAAGEALLLVQGDAPMVRDLDHATQNARARAVWAPGFGGSALGFNGKPNTTIGIIDTGIDDSHPDLAGRMAYWKDFEGSSATPVDLVGHGSCVASIALGSGAAFEASKPSLRFTRSASLTGFNARVAPYRAPLSYGTAGLTLSATTTYQSDGGVAQLALSSTPEGTKNYSTVYNSNGPSPLSWSRLIGPQFGTAYSIGPSALVDKTIDWTVTQVTATPYPQVGDGLPTLRGLAPGCRWAAVRGADDAFTVEESFDDLLTQRQAIGLKVINLSQSPPVDAGTLLAQKATALVQGGVILVKTAGNTGRQAVNNLVTTPGQLGLVFTVGATSNVNQLTDYTSAGATTQGPGEDLKPDLLAPGGSLFRIDMLCADSNDSDNPDGGADLVPDDYAPEEGTSFAAPVVAGASALVIEALESKGLVWDWNSADHPRLVKSLLLATATETNQEREAPPSPSPLLGRSTIQKDRAEGYGVLNVDAALEAITVDLQVPSEGVTDGGAYDRRAWGRKVALTAGTPLQLSLEVPITADFDLYLYGSTPDPFGNPVLLAAADRAGLGKGEVLDYAPTATGSAVLVVKRLEGGGQWRILPRPVCGNGQREVAEDCDDGNLDGGDCCSSTCQAEALGQACPAGRCGGGVCIPAICGDAVISGPETCDDDNTRSGDCCSSTCQVDPDGTRCFDGVCRAGACVAVTPTPAIDGGVVEGPSAASCGCSAAGSLPGVLLLLALRRSRRTGSPAP